MNHRSVLLNLLAAYLMFAASATPAIAATPPGINGSGTMVYIGTQGDALLGARLDIDTGKLVVSGAVADIKRPTWIVVDPNRPVLYATNELGNEGQEKGYVYSLAIDRATAALKIISKVESGGGGPTYLNYDPRSSTLFVSNFGGGQVAAIPVGDDGRLSPAASIVTDVGTGSTAKQLIPHAHAATLDPSGRFVVNPDMGVDRIFVYRFDAAARKLAPNDPAFLATEPGTGPRHLVFSPDGHFVFSLIELAAEVRSFRWDAKAGKLQPVQTVALDRPDFKGVRSAAEVIVSSDGRFVYATNRARSMLFTFAVNTQDGRLRPVQEIPCGGIWPRSMAIDPSGRWMLVANQESRTITVFRVDAKSGKLTPVGEPVPVTFKPAVFAFLRTR